MWLPLELPLLETSPTTQACALDWKSNWQPFDAQAGTQSTKPHQPGPLIVIFNIMMMFPFLQASQLTDIFYLSYGCHPVIYSNIILHSMNKRRTSKKRKEQNRKSPCLTYFISPTPQNPFQIRKHCIFLNTMVKSMKTVLWSKKIYE